jgi:hypothetical protein
MANRRGLSAVVTTLIIILLVLVAIGIVWVVVRGVVEGGAGQIDITAQCLAVDMNAVGVVETSAGVYDVTLERSAGGDAIDGVKLVLFNLTGNSAVLNFSAGPDELETVTRSIDTGDTGNATKLDYTVYFLDESGNEVLCTQTGHFNF